jgi:hypothetical protein
VARIVSAVRTEVRCKVCKAGAEKRGRIDELLAQRGAADVPTWGKAEALATIILGQQVTARGLRRHLADHCRVEELSDEQIEAAAAKAAEEIEGEAAEKAATLALFDQILGPGWQDGVPSADSLLALQRALYVRGLRQDVKAGLSLKLTHDQINRGIAESTRRKSSEATAELLKGLGAAVGQWGQRIVAEGDACAGELETGEIEDAEFEEIEQ